MVKVLPVAFVAIVGPLITTLLTVAIDVVDAVPQAIVG